MDFIAKLKSLSSANEFLEFFGIPYDEKVVNVNRLHILKRFYQYLHQADLSAVQGLDELALFTRYRELLLRAYKDFTTSSGVQEKVFKVFQDAAGQQSVPLNKLRDSLAERRGGGISSPAARAA